VGLAAIVVVETGTEDSYPAAPADTKTKQKAGVAESLPCVEIMGRSMLERTIERFVHANVDVVRVLMADDAACAAQPARSVFDSVRFKSVSDVGSAIGQEKQRVFKKKCNKKSNERIVSFRIVKLKE